MDTVTLTSSTIELYPVSVGLNIVVPGTLTPSPDGSSASFMPTSPLEAETQYGVYLTGVTDLKGTAIQQHDLQHIHHRSGQPDERADGGGGDATQRNRRGGGEREGTGAGKRAPVSAVSVGSNSLTLTAGSTPVTGPVGASGSVVTFTPASPLAVSTSYTVAASGFTDLAGNQVTPFTSSFTTGSSAVADTTAPTVSSVAPANLATNVAVGSSVVVTFSETVNPLTVGTGAVRISVSGVNLAGNYVVNGAVVTFTPLTPFPGNVTVSVSVSGVTDLAGNPNTGFSSSFTTAAMVDTTPPTILSVTPANGATGIGPNGQVVIAFSKSMNPGTLTACCSGGFYNNVSLFANGSRLSFSPSVSSDNRTLVLSSFSLPAASTISVIVTHAVTDLSGNALADFQSQFTTAPSFDTSHGSVVNQRPGNGATGVPVTSGVTLFVNKSLNAGTVPNAVHISQNGQLVNGTVNVTNNGQTVQFTPTTALQNGALIQVFLDTTATDTSGNTVNSYQGSFTTVSDPNTTAPGVVNDIPVNGAGNVPLNAVVEVAYNETLSAATVNTTNVFFETEQWDEVGLDGEPGCDRDGDSDNADCGAGGEHGILLCRAERAGDQREGGAELQRVLHHGDQFADGGADGGGGESQGPVGQCADQRQHPGAVQRADRPDVGERDDDPGERRRAAGAAGLDQLQQRQPDRADHGAERAAGLNGDDGGDLGSEGCGRQCGDGANHSLHNSRGAADV